MYQIVENILSQEKLRMDVLYDLMKYHYQVLKR